MYGGGQLGIRASIPPSTPLLPPTPEAWSQYRSIYHRGNDYQMTGRAAQGSVSQGLPGVWPQDSRARRALGTIYDVRRVTGPGDHADIARARKFATAGDGTTARRANFDTAG